MMSDRTLLGVLTPSSNTRLEPMTARMLASLPGVSAHFSRFRVVDVGLAAAHQFDQEPILAAADLLADAQVDSIVWSGTSGGWRGLAADRDSVRCDHRTYWRAEQYLDPGAGRGPAAAGRSATRPGDAVPGRYARRRGHHVHRAGYDVVGSNRAVTSSNWELSEIPPEVIAEQVAETMEGDPDAVTVFCTNLAAADRVAEWEAAYGVPVLDSVSLAVWHGLALAGYAGPALTGWGRLFDLVA